MLQYWVALFLAVCANIFANIALKIAVGNTVENTSGNIFAALARDPWTWAGLTGAALLLACYLYAIRAIDIIVAYPSVTGTAMAGVALASYVVLSEPINSNRIIGIGLIAVGVFLLAQPCRS